MMMLMDGWMMRMLMRMRIHSVFFTMISILYHIISSSIYLYLSDHLSIYLSRSGGDSDPLKIDLSKPNNFTRGNIIIYRYHHVPSLSTILVIIIIYHRYHYLPSSLSSSLSMSIHTILLLSVNVLRQ